MSDLLSFLDLEAGFESLVLPMWEKQAREMAESAANYIEKDDEESAVKVMQEISTKKILKHAKGGAKTLAVASLLLGASEVNSKSTIFDDGDIPPEVNKAVDVFLTIMGRVLEEHIRKTVPPVIDEIFDERKNPILTKAADMELVARLNKAVNGGGQMMASISANLTTSRLVSYGFLSQARADGVEVYQLQAIMDQRTSKICRALNGRTFSVNRAYTHLQNVLQITDPEALKSAAPWLKADSGSVDDYQHLNTHALEDKYGVLVPPFHPSCRTVLVQLSSGQNVSAQSAGTHAADTPTPPPPQEYTTQLPSGFVVDSKNDWGILEDWAKQEGYLDDIGNKALLRYTGAGYKQMNGVLRSEVAGNEKTMADIKAMDELFQPLLEDKVVFRGRPGHVDVKAGDTVPQLGYVSTSGSRHKAFQFGLKHWDEEYAEIGTVFELRLPKGYPVILTNYKEAEAILPHGKKFVIQSVTDNVKGDWVKSSKTQKTTISRHIVMVPVDE